MLKKAFTKILIAVGITIWAIPFLSAALFGLAILGLVWLKQKIATVAIPALIKAL
jgi:hypothetical protein